MTISKLLDKLFRLHNKELLFFAGLRSGNSAEDLVQEAYLRLLKHPDPNSIQNLRAFLFKTTTNLSIDLHRRKIIESKYQHEDESDIDIDTLGIEAESLEPDSLTSHHQELDLLQNMLNELPEITRYVFILRRIDGMSHAEIAEQLEISTRSSKHHLHIAMQHLLKHGNFEE
jgi:RNA polymerase sigma factor (sigma-70 family)